MLWSGMPLGNRGIFIQCLRRKRTSESHGHGVCSLYRLWAIGGYGINICSLHTMPSVCGQCSKQEKTETVGLLSACQQSDLND